MDFNNKCLNCKKSIHCCIFKDNSGFTFVGIKDAKKIKKELNKKIIEQNIKVNYSDFLDYSPLPNKILSALKNDDPSLEGALRYSQLDSIKSDKTNKKTRLLRLKKKEEGRCIFLDKNNKCEIYNVRPELCRIYPFWGMRLINNKIKIIQHDPYPGCQVIKSMTNSQSKNKKEEKTKKQKKETYFDIEKVMTKNEIKNIQTIFRKIEKENIYYKKNIKKFVKENL